MKKLIFIQLYKDILIFFFISLFLTGVIVWTIQAVNYFDFVTEDGHGLKIYFYYSILNFPKIIQRILPFVYFLSVFYIIVNYETRNELIIFWTNGISKVKFLNILIIFSLLITFLQLVLGSYIAPNSKFKARDFIKNSNIDLFTSLIKEGKFLNIAKNVTIYINKKENDGTLKDIFLEEVDKNKSRMIYASRGRIVDISQTKNLQLFNGRVINFDNQKINIFNFDQIDFNLDKFRSKTITTPKIQEIGTITLLGCFFDLNIKKYQSFECNDNALEEVKLELFKRLHKPIYIPVVILFSCFLILYSNKQKSYNYKKNMIFLIIFFIIVFSEVSTRYLINSNILIYIIILFPVIIFSTGYSFFIRLSRNV